MAAKSRQKQKTPLENLLEKADAATLRELIAELAAARSDVRRECFDFLKENLALDKDESADAEAEALFALWGELEMELDELEECGGSDYRLRDDVDTLLYEFTEKLNKSCIPREARRHLLDGILRHIRSDWTGLEDGLFDAAYAVCKEDADLRAFAEYLEATGVDWMIGHARRIYRQIDDEGKYLDLRALKMEYGADYHDLATFHWEKGRKDRALEIAREGMEKGQGRMQELREFLSDRAKESGDRATYLELQFAQATDGLRLETYKAFRKICNDEEWTEYEPRILESLEKARGTEQLKIRMARKEYDQAVAILTKTRFPFFRGPGLYGEELKIAKRLEARYPDKILAFYMSGLGKLDSSETRKIYALKAQVACLVRHMWVEVIKEPAQWEAFARQVKTANQRRPAFQEEFGKAVPGWREL